MNEPLACTVCGDAIGTYEPLVVAARGTVRLTALAREPEAAAGAEVTVHWSCAEQDHATRVGIAPSALVQLHQRRSRSRPEHPAGHAAVLSRRDLRGVVG